MNALILDADKKERDEIKEKLKQKGISATEGEGGFEMLDDMSQFKKDLIVLDYNTWRANRGVYRYFGVEKIWQGTPIIVISPNRRTDIFSKRHSMEKDSIIEKPFNSESFEKALSAIV